MATEVKRTKGADMAARIFLANGIIRAHEVETIANTISVETRDGEMAELLRRLVACEDLSDVKYIARDAEKLLSEIGAGD